MIHVQTTIIWYSLVLADGTFWKIGGLDAEAAVLVAQLALAMRLHPLQEDAVPLHSGPPCRLLVKVDAHSPIADCYVPLASERNGDVVCILSPCADWGGPFVNLTRLSLVIAREAQARGGLLLHGALAEHKGRGMILAAPGGTGKTTASNRLSAPWCSHCDDTTLVVQDSNGRFWAHPWPTWSRFLNDGAGGAWPVEDALPLQAIFVLHQAVMDQAERVGAGRAIALLLECAGQATQFMPLGLKKAALRGLYGERFDNLAALTRKTPVALLHLSLTGSFWQEMTRMLAESDDMQAGIAEMDCAEQMPGLLPGYAKA